MMKTLLCCSSLNNSKKFVFGPFTPATAISVDGSTTIWIKSCSVSALLRKRLKSKVMEENERMRAILGELSTSATKELNSRIRTRSNKSPDCLVAISTTDVYKSVEVFNHVILTGPLLMIEDNQTQVADHASHVTLGSAMPHATINIGYRGPKLAGVPVEPSDPAKYAPLCYVFIWALFYKERKDVIRQLVVLEDIDIYDRNGKVGRKAGLIDMPSGAYIFRFGCGDGKSGYHNPKCVEPLMYQKICLTASSQYKDAKTLFETIQARFGGNDTTKKTQRTLLKQTYENFNAPSTESFDSIFNRLQKIVSQLAILSENISQEDLNMKFLRSLLAEWNTHVVVVTDIVKGTKSKQNRTKPSTK
uniref:Uncharacterized protein n=1 Tax=Tanacetum cinerariifolium TaxID=118510 RepID=A0A6L2MKE8_TANCI|nr:hypothetical protein [Tanacetum cinerariifolium]